MSNHDDDDSDSDDDNRVPLFDETTNVKSNTGGNGLYKLRIWLRNVFDMKEYLAMDDFPATFNYRD